MTALLPRNDATGCLVLVVTLILFVIGAAAPPPGIAQSAQITGQVLDAEEAPVPGANVVLQQEGAVVQGTSTNDDGAYQLTDVQPGSYVLRVSAIGYETVTRRVAPSSGETLTADFQLDAARYGLGEVVVSATRQPERQRSVPSAVSVLGTESLDQQLTLSSDVGDVLAQEVPGLAPTTHSLSNFGQTIRGRSLFVLIDGVPQTVPLRNALRDLRTVDPGAIERVEVIRGASATYGYGANGGLINYITEQADREGVHGEIELGTRSQPAEVESSASGRVRGEVQLKRGRYDALVSAGYESHGYFFDGEGDRIPQDPQGQGGLADAEEVNVLLRGGVQLTPEQRLDLSANVYTFFQNLEYETVPGTPGETKATAERSGDIRGEDPGTRNVVSSLRYTHEDLAGSSVSAQLYLQDYKTRFTFAPFFPDGGGQGFLDAEKWGARVDVSTPLALTPDTELQWGIDALHDETAQPLEDGRTFVPEMRQWSVAPFAQLHVPVGDRVRLRGGARYESFSLSVDDYTTLFGDRPVEGGDLTYDSFVFNAGAIVTLAEPVDLFASFSQGYSVADVGRVLRSPPAEAEDFSVESLRPDAQTVNSYEAGLRGGTSRLDASVTGFLNASDRGSTFGDFPELEPVRTPERVYGVEATLESQVHPLVRAGGTATIMEGKRDVDDDGSFGEYLPNSRIPPTKLTGFVAVAPPNERWRVRAQLLYSGNRDTFDGEAETVFGQGDVDAYTVVDLAASVDAGPGTIGVGIDNVFDNFYFPTVSQWYNLGNGYSAAPGRRVSLDYSLQF